jgi:hypothetical protein
MDLRDRIDAALRAKKLDPNDFERCALELLREIYPRLTPITGGTDFGRDGDVDGLDDGPRLLATTGAPLANVQTGLRRLREEGVKATKGIVLVTSRPVSATLRQRLGVVIKSAGSKLLNVHDQTWFAGALRHDGYWRRRLLEVSAGLSALVTRPLELLLLGEELALVGRAEILAEINRGADDLILVGAPGLGKTRLLAECDRMTFLEDGATSSRLADDLDDLRPAVVIIEDAVRRPTDVRMVLRMRTEESGRNFRIVATAWADEVDTALGQLPGAMQLSLDLLELGDVDAILAQLNITDYWRRAAILDQARGRPGWAMLLARASTSGRIRDVFDGQALTDEVGRYLTRAGMGDSGLRFLAHVALRDGVAEDDLGALARQLGVTLPELMRTLHRTTHNGVLERAFRTWQVQPEVLRLALIERWFLAEDASEPLEVLLQERPEDEELLVMAAIEVARVGSLRGREIARSRVPSLTKDLALDPEGCCELLTAYGRVDREAAAWVIRERVRPAFEIEHLGEGSRRRLMALVVDVVEQFQIEEAVGVLLTQAVSDPGRPSDLGHPIKTLQETSKRILPDALDTTTRRRDIFNATIHWVDSGADELKWHVATQVWASALSPNGEGSWNDPSAPMKFIVGTTIESPTTMGVIGGELWSQVTARIDRIPDSAVLPLARLASAWLVVAGALATAPLTPNAAQRRAARTVARQMVRTLEARCRDSPGLALGCKRLLGRRTRFAVNVAADFAILAGEPGGVRDWDEHEPRLRALARQWASEEPHEVVRRLKAWLPQLLLVGSGLGLASAFLGMMSEAAADPELWAEAVVAERLEPGTMVFLPALRTRLDDTVPTWFLTALECSELRIGALAAALSPGAYRATTLTAVSALGPDDVHAVGTSLLRHSESDAIVSALLRHDVLEVRWFTAVALGHPDRRRFALDDADQHAWEAAIGSCELERLEDDSEYAFGEALEYIAVHHPEIAVKWFDRRLSSAETKRLHEAVPRDVRPALTALAPEWKTGILARASRHWRRLLLEYGVAGADPSWVIDAVDAGTMAVEDAAYAIGGEHFETYKKISPELLRRGLDVKTALLRLEWRARLGVESGLYAELLAQCEEMASSADPQLAELGRAGAPSFRRARDDALKEEHRERVLRS